MERCSKSASRLVNLPLQVQCATTWAAITGLENLHPQSRAGHAALIFRRADIDFKVYMAWRLFAGDAVGVGTAPPATQLRMDCSTRSRGFPMGDEAPRTSSAIEIIRRESSSERGSGRWGIATTKPAPRSPLAERHTQNGYRLDSARMPDHCPDPERGPSVPDPQSYAEYYNRMPYPSSPRRRPYWCPRRRLLTRSSPNPGDSIRICPDGLNGRATGGFPGLRPTSPECSDFQRPVHRNPLRCTG